MRMRGAWVDADLAWLKALLLCMLLVRLLHGVTAAAVAEADKKPNVLTLPCAQVLPGPATQDTAASVRKACPPHI